MVRYKTILKVIEEEVAKCSTTVKEMHTLLNKWSQKEKNTLLYYTVEGFDEKKYNELLENGSEDEIFDYERQIFENSTDNTRDNLLKYCTDFEEMDYQEDDDVGYPSGNRGKLEARQEQLQEEKGYDDLIKRAILEHWTGGYYRDIQGYHLGKYSKDYLIEMYGEEVFNSVGVIDNYIDNSVGLEVNTVLYRGGHWDKGIKVGSVGELPCLSSTSYSEQTADEVGRMGSSRKYMIKIYAPKGTKGVMVNAPSLRNQYGGHEYLLGKGQKYIVLDVDDTNNTATIKLIND